MGATCFDIAGALSKMQEPVLEQTKTRFWQKVRKSRSGCWLWIAGTNHGYGRFVCDYRSVYAHRFAFELLVGPVPLGMVLDHLCRIRRCVNPAHLEVVTHKENILRGNALPARYARMTHCQRGHLLQGENLAYKQGYRRCVECYRSGWNKYNHSERCHRLRREWRKRTSV